MGDYYRTFEGKGERAVLVRLALGAVVDEENEFLEFQQLAITAGALSVGIVRGSRHKPDARLFVGRGKAEEIRHAVIQGRAQLVLFDHTLSPSQERNLETLLQCRVVDRTGLILDIFAQRARSFEGKLQVELAQLQHMRPRLVKGWTHLERQKGGIGLRGPGETQLETDRRLLGGRIRQINLRLRKVDRQRSHGRRARGRASVPTVSLVGYTNAGKSTLFKSLAHADVYVADQLFATLDPTLRSLPLARGRRIILADTVGFIKHLPHELIAAFRSTLQEICESSLLLHVIDSANPACSGYEEHVDKILEEIGAGSVSCLKIFNKIDLLNIAPRIERNADGQVRSVWLSAAKGLGLDLLLTAISESVYSDTVRGWMQLPQEASRLRAKLFSLGAVVTERLHPGGGWLIEVETSQRNLKLLSSSEGFREEWLGSFF